jgi:hypothetical protein
MNNPINSLLAVVPKLKAAWFLVCLFYTSSINAAYYDKVCEIFQKHIQLHVITIEKNYELYFKEEDIEVAKAQWDHIMTLEKELLHYLELKKALCI